MPVTSYYNDLTQRLRKDLTAEKDATTKTINAGMLTFEQYKRETGKLAGLTKAEELLEKAVADAMKG